MKKVKTKIYLRVGFITLTLMLFYNITWSQQDPMYTQYMFNTQTINPAYAGSWNSIGFLALSRMQWVGVKGAPTTQTFSFQMPVFHEKMGIGVNLINDKIGVEKRFGFFVDYSYKIEFQKSTNLRMGIKGGFFNYSNNLTNHVLYPEGNYDPLFQSDIKHKFLPNVGVGLLLENPVYYAGISIPKIVNSKYESNGNNFSITGEIRSFFVIAGYVHDLTKEIKLKPTILLKTTTGAPIEVDLSANFLLKEKFWLGAMYRTGDSFGFIAQWIIDKNLRIGYAFDFSTSRLQPFHYNTHEVMVSYELKIVRKQITSPRFF